MLETGKQILANQPFSRLLKAEILDFEIGRAELSLPISNDVLQQHGFVHGGAISFLADNALTFAGGSSMGVAVVTSEFKINYIRPAVGQTLLARAVTIHSGKTQAVCRCDLFVVKDGVEKLCAIAQGTIVRIGKEGG